MRLHQKQQAAPVDRGPLFIAVSLLLALGVVSPAGAARRSAPPSRHRHTRRAKGNGRAARAEARQVTDGLETGLSFLRSPVLSPAELARAAAEPQVRERYAKHFSVSEKAAGKALAAAQPAKLPPGMYTVWLRRADGMRYPTRQTRDTPTHVFIVALPTPSGPHAWLEQGSGNPIEPFRPAEHVDVVVDTLPGRVIETPHEILVPIPPPPLPPPPPPQ